MRKLLSKTVSVFLLAMFTFVSTCAYANTYSDGSGVAYGQAGEVRVFYVERDTGNKVNFTMNTPENGGPMLDDEAGALMPMKTMCVYLGYEYIEEDEYYDISNGLRNINIQKDEQAAYIDGEEYDFKYELINNELYFPYQYLDTLFDLDVDWDNENKVITLTERDTTPIPEEELKRREEEQNLYSYSDCDDEAVKYLTRLNVLAGYEDGTFRPDASLTRAEFSKMIALVTGGEAAQGAFEPVFSDAGADHWAFDYVMYCNALGYLEGYEDGTFRPNENVSLAEAAKICLTAVGYNELITEENTDEWYAPWLELAYEYGLTDSESADPNRNLTRAEAANMISTTINLPLYMISGYDFATGTAVPVFQFMDGSSIDAMPFTSLYTTHFGEK